MQAEEQCGRCGINLGLATGTGPRTVVGPRAWPAEARREVVSDPARTCVLVTYDAHRNAAGILVITKGIRMEAARRDSAPELVDGDGWSKLKSNTMPVCAAGRRERGRTDGLAGATKIDPRALKYQESSQGQEPGHGRAPCGKRRRVDGDPRHRDGSRRWQPWARDIRCPRRSSRR